MLLDNLVRWSYKLEDGYITDSMALETARLFGVSSQLIQRALELKSQLNSTLSNELSQQNSSSPTDSLSLNNSNKYSLDLIQKIISQALETSSLRKHILSPNISLIPFGCLTSPVLESHCCVYVLVFKDIEGYSNHKLEVYCYFNYFFIFAC